MGAGLSGICLSVALLDKGLCSKVPSDPSPQGPQDGLLILEQGAEVGGTWHWNRYPGCACDVESYAYLPFLSRMGFIPTKKYVSADEIGAYLVSVATMLGVRDKTVFGTRATEAFLRSDGTYKVLTNRGDILTCDFLVLAQGVLSTPKLPDIEGLSRFRGELIHSSSWPRGLDLTGRTVGVIGTGATAVQLIPEAAKKAKQLYVFQRTPTWAGPRDDELTPSDLAARIRAEPGFVESLVAKRSAEIDLFNETLNSPAKNERLCRLLGDRIASVVDDPTVAAALTPTYPVGCKRLCVVDDYYPTFNLPHVALIADPKGVTEVTEKGPRLGDGRQFDVDVLVLATGYAAFTGAFRGFPVRGVGGQTLLSQWANGPKALYGIHVRRFPNMFIMVGPQGPGIIANVTATIGVQADHITDVIARVIAARRRLGRPVNVEASAAAVQRWDERCASKVPVSVWSKCSSWYNETGSVEGWVGTFQEYLDSLSTELNYSSTTYPTATSSL